MNLCPIATHIRAQVVVMTCTLAGMLSCMEVPQGHFTHIFIDESSQATELDTIIPLALTTPDTCVVLAGEMGFSVNIVNQLCKRDCVCACQQADYHCLLSHR